jgi:hypothetical protein
MPENRHNPQADSQPAAVPAKEPARPPKEMPKEVGGPTGPEPTRYGDWEKNGRCSDF